MEINLNEKLNRNHSDFFKATDEEIIFYGGAAGGKSYSVADKLLIQPIIQRRPLKMMVIRKSMPSLKRTCIPLLRERADAFNIPAKMNFSDMTLSLPFKSRIEFMSINHYTEIEKIKSITDADMAWMEEANELSEEAYDQVQLRLRGGKGLFKQSIITFNPIGTTNWIYDKFFQRINTARKIHVTAYSNQFIEKSYIRKLEALKNSNENLYRVYCLGQWGALEGTIYKAWDIVSSIPEKVEEVIYGLDFGYNNPSALVKVSICDNVPFIEEKLYRSGFTNSDLINELKSAGIGNSLIYADSAEPQRIEELRRAGFNVIEASKSVNDGIDFVQSIAIKIIEGSENLIKEHQSYCWHKGPEGKYIDKPVKFRDHLMDAIRYALYTHFKDRFEFMAVGADGGEMSASGSLLNDIAEGNI